MMMNNIDELTARVVDCRQCPRLVEWRESVARTRRRAFRDQEYWGKPVPGFGDPLARLHVVGLAPAAHGANRTGRNFTGDSSGDYLYRALYKEGFANQPTSVHKDDGLALTDVYISGVCRCAPPDNKPTPAEITACRPFLVAEHGLLRNVQGYVALGRIGYEGLLDVFRDLGYTLDRPRLKKTFAHNALVEPGEGLPWIITSYHPSRQNTQTGRLTEAMFDAVWQHARRLLDGKMSS